MCTFGNLAYFKSLFRNESLAVFFLARFLFVALSLRMIKFPTSCHREQISLKFVLVEKHIWESAKGHATADYSLHNK